ncbi:MAG: GH3 auxin-responsive promoter family protein [Rhodanobacteraceae bacterium]|nr:GH3 auxin-responsive promoter family protein [Rhodanobacteraceae bacterium]
MTTAQKPSHYLRFVEGLDSATDTQDALLKRLIASGRDTAFGREHGFEHIDSLADFRRQVPLRRYDELQPYVDRIVAGERDVLFTGEVFRFISSSGSSSGQAKVLPLPRAYFAETFNPFYLTFLEGAVRAHPGLAASADCTINFKWDPLRDTSMLTSGAPHVGLSQVNLANEFSSDALREPGTQGPWATVPADIAADLDRLYFRLRMAVGHDIRQFVGINPAILAVVPYLLDSNAERLFADVADGTFAGRPVAAPDPALAAQLAARRTTRGRLVPADVWPNVERLICWDEGMAGIYLPQVVRDYGREVAVVPAPLAASEAPLALHLLPHGLRGVLAYNAVFFEFLDSQAGPRQTPLRLDELRKGASYAVVVTQAGGFCRYVLGDLLEVTGRAGAVPTVAYAGRLAPSAAVPESALLNFMRRYNATHGLRLRHFTFVPNAKNGLDGQDRLDLRFACDAENNTPFDEASLRHAYAADHALAAVPLGAVQQVSASDFDRDWCARVAAGLRPPQVKDRIVSALP